MGTLWRLKQKEEPRCDAKACLQHRSQSNEPRQVTSSNAKLLRKWLDLRILRHQDERRTGSRPMAVEFGKPCEAIAPQYPDVS